MQLNRERMPVYKAIVSMEEQSNLSTGDVVHRTFGSKLLVSTYTKGTDVTDDDITITDESLTVDQTPIISFYVDEIDKLQNSIDAQMEYADRASDRLERYIDAQVLGEVANADHTVNNVDFGGTGAVTASTSNLVKIFALAGKKLTRAEIGNEGRYAVLSPSIFQLLEERTEGRDTAAGDDVMKNGFTGRSFLGFEIFVSNNLYYTASWTPADNPSADDTVTIAGVVLTFKASPAAAGEVDIGGSTAVTIDNMVTLLNDPGTTTATGIALSAADQRTLMGLTAVDGTTTLDLQWEGGGEAAVSASETADTWGSEIVHQLFGQKGAIDMVMQKAPNVTFKDPEKRLGVRVLTWALYGLKTFDEGDAALVDVQIDGSSL
jgi:hypothetical protein